MSLWNTIKSWFKSEEPVTEKDLTHPAPDSADVEALFIEVCNERGVGAKILEKTDAVSKFLAWYKGPATKKGIVHSLDDFLLCDDVNDSKLGRLRQ